MRKLVIFGFILVISLICLSLVSASWYSGIVDFFNKINGKEKVQLSPEIPICEVTAQAGSSSCDSGYRCWPLRNTFGQHPAGDYKIVYVSGAWTILNSRAPIGWGATNFLYYTYSGNDLSYNLWPVQGMEFSDPNGYAQAEAYYKNSAASFSHSGVGEIRVGLGMDYYPYDNSGSITFKLVGGDCPCVADSDCPTDNICETGKCVDCIKTTFYQDSDSDSYGNPSVSQSACTQPAGYVTDNSDCNDNNFSINPSATEICDGVDNNCDGVVDENLNMNYYKDFDEDGFGDSNINLQACTQPAGYVINNTDCNDDNSLIKPNATEICDGVDNNCNREVDEDKISLGPEKKEVFSGSRNVYVGMDEYQIVSSSEARYVSSEGIDGCVALVIPMKKENKVLVAHFHWNGERTDSLLEDIFNNLPDIKDKNILLIGGYNGSGSQEIFIKSQALVSKLKSAFSDKDFRFLGVDKHMGGGVIRDLIYDTQDSKLYLPYAGVSYEVLDKLSKMCTEPGNIGECQIGIQKCSNGVYGSCEVPVCAPIHPITNVTLSADKEYLSHIGVDKNEYDQEVFMRDENKTYYVATENDDLRCEVSGEGIQSAKLGMNEILDATCKDGKCYAVFKGPWTRGTKVQCFVDEVNGDLVDNSSSEVIIAKYNYYFAKVNQEDWGNAKEQYENYVNISAVNSRWDMAGKPVYITQAENIDLDTVFSKSLGNLGWNQGACSKDSDCRSDVTKDNKKLVCTNGHGTLTNQNLCCWEGQQINGGGTRGCYNPNEQDKQWYESVTKIPKGTMNWNEGDCKNDDSKCRDDVTYTGEGTFTGSKLACIDGPNHGLFGADTDKCCWRGQQILEVNGKEECFGDRGNNDQSNELQKAWYSTPGNVPNVPLGKIEWNKGPCDEGDCRQDITYDNKKLVCMDGYRSDVDKDICCWENQTVVIMPDGTRECYNSNEADKKWYSDNYKNYIPGYLKREKLFDQVIGNFNLKLADKDKIIIVSKDIMDRNMKTLQSSVDYISSQFIEGPGQKIAFLPPSLLIFGVNGASSLVGGSVLIGPEAEEKISKGIGWILSVPGKVASGILWVGDKATFGAVGYIQRMIIDFPVGKLREFLGSSENMPTGNELSWPGEKGIILRGQRLSIFIGESRFALAKSMGVSYSGLCDERTLSLYISNSENYAFGSSKSCPNEFPECCKDGLVEKWLTSLKVLYENYPGVGTVNSWILQRIIDPTETVANINLYVTQINSCGAEYNCPGMPEGYSQNKADIYAPWHIMGNLKGPIRPSVFNVKEFYYDDKICKEPLA